MNRYKVYQVLVVLIIIGVILCMAGITGVVLWLDGYDSAKKHYDVVIKKEVCKDQELLKMLSKNRKDAP